VAEGWKVGDTLIILLLKVFFVIARNSRKVSAEGASVILAIMPAKRGGSVARFCRKPRVLLPAFLLATRRVQN
jgi:hypothetical protein